MLVCIRRRVIDECANFFRSRQQAGEVERDAPDERCLVGLRRRMQAGLLHLSKHKIINRRLGPTDIRLRIRFRPGNGRPAGRFKGPVRPVHRALPDPFRQGLDFFGPHGLGLALRRLRHEVMRILRFDALDQFTFFGVSGNDRIGPLRAFLHRQLGKIQAEAGLTHFRVRAMTTEATVRQYWLYIFVEIEVGFRGLLVLASGQNCSC